MQFYANISPSFTNLCFEPIFSIHKYIDDYVHSTITGEFVIIADDTNYKFISADSKLEAYNNANQVIKSVYLYMNANKLHIQVNVLTCFANLTWINNCEPCARSQNYDLNLQLSINGLLVKQVDLL